MSDLLLLSNFFLDLIILVIVISVASQLVDIEADLYYYTEVKCKGEDDDNIQHTNDSVMLDDCRFTCILKVLKKIVREVKRV